MTESHELEIEPLKGICILDEGFLTLQIGDDDDDRPRYEIAMSDLQMPSDILRFVAHLSEKSWMTGEQFRQFVRVASSAQGNPLYPED